MALRSDDAKNVPRGETGVGVERIGNVRLDAHDAREHRREDRHLQQRDGERPRDTEDRVLVPDDEISAHEGEDQLTCVEYALNHSAFILAVPRAACHHERSEGSRPVVITSAARDLAAACHHERSEGSAVSCHHERSEGSRRYGLNVNFCTRQFSSSAT